jgi:hypothetical protein
MLTTDALRNAIEQAQGDADVCTRFCAVGGTCGESVYRIHHNGVGSSDTREHQVSAGWVLKLSEDQLRPWLTAWLTATHDGQPFDLNTRRRDPRDF